MASAQPAAESPAPKTILVCTNVDCAERGAEALLAKFDDAVDDRGHIEVRDYLCFSACEKGPNVIVVEDRVWYCNVTDDDVEEIATEHLDGGRPVTRLTEGTDSTTRNLIFTVLDAGLMPGSVG